MVATTANVAITKDETANIIIVIDDKIDDWSAVEGIIKTGLPTRPDFSLPADLKAKQLHDCEYANFWESDRNTVSFIIASTKPGSTFPEVCVLKGIFSSFGLDPDPENKARDSKDIDIVDSLLVIREMYHLDKLNRQVSVFLPVIFDGVWRAIAKYRH